MRFEQAKALLAAFEREGVALHSVFDDPAIDEISSGDLSGSYPVVRYGPPDEDFVIDLLSRLGDAFAFADIEYEEMMVDGTPVRVATPSMLFRMKRSTVRPQDQVDAHAIQERFDLQSEDEV